LDITLSDVILRNPIPLCVHGENDFAEASKNLARYENNCVKLLKLLCRSSNSEQCCKNVIDILATSLSVLHNYFDGLVKL